MNIDIDFISILQQFKFFTLQLKVNKNFNKRKNNHSKTKTTFIQFSSRLCVMAKITMNFGMYSGTPVKRSPRNWENLFVITGVRYIGFLCHTFYYYWAEEYRSLYRGLRYTGVFVIPRPSLYRGLRYTEVFVILRSSLYRGLRYTGVFVLPGSSLYRGLRYTGVFVIPRSSL